MENYRRPWWAPGRHLQTVLPPIVNRLRGEPAHGWERERWKTPDGSDFIDIDWTKGAGGGDLLVLFHGLEGDRDAHYSRELAAQALANGWRFACVHFRGCSGEDNLACRAYHAGDSDEIDWILRRFAAKEGRPVCAAGVSLGGNALLKWLGEQGYRANTAVRRAAAVGAPIDLASFGRSLERGFGRLYSWYFLNATPLCDKARRILQRCPGAFDAAALEAARTLPEFDAAVTAPLHGFNGLADYWRRGSALPVLDGIRAPTLILNARNDPFLPEEVLDGLQQNSAELAPEVVLEFPRHGGHCGFPGRHDWMARRVLEFVSAP